MASPWLDVPLADYEAHMELVGQAQLLDRLFARALQATRPDSVALLGAAGGNGLRHIADRDIDPIVAVDINPRYLQALEQRHAGHIRNLQVICADLDDPTLDLPPVSLVHAALVFEYVDVVALLARIRRWLRPGGTLSVVLQLPDGAHSAVTPSPFTSLARLAPIMSLQPSKDFRSLAAAAGFTETGFETAALASGKQFLFATHAAAPFGEPAAKV